MSRLSISMRQQVVRSLLACSLVLATVPALGLTRTGSKEIPSAIPEVHRLYRLRLVPGSTLLEQLTHKGFDIAGRNLEKNTIDVLAHTQGEVQELSRLGEMVITSWDTDARKAPDSRYKNPAEIEEILTGFVTQYPELASLHSIGKSVEGRPLWAVKVTGKGNPEGKGKPALLFNGMHHAREVMTPEVVLDTLEQLVTAYGQDPKVTHWVDTTEIWLVPMLNPDGNQRVWNQNSMWRKNTRGGYGVDINRNYPFGWGSCRGSSGNTQSETYRGPSAGSEPETQALMGLVEAIEPVFNISYHSYSEMVLYPYGCSGVYTETRDVIEPLGREIAAALPRENSSGTYTPGTSWEILYSVDGSDMDWMYGQHHVIPFVIELNSDQQGFQPPFTWRQPTVEKMRAAWGRLFERLDQSSIHGTVSQADGSMISSIPITVEQETSTGLTPVLKTRSKKNGSFHLILNPGTYKVSFGSPPTQKIQWIPLGDARRELEIVFE